MDTGSLIVVVMLVLFAAGLVWAVALSSRRPARPLPEPDAPSDEAR